MPFRSWLSCWMRRSWAGFQSSSSPTSRTCWQPPPPPRSRRGSTCTPSATASGRSRRAPPSQERASRSAPGPIHLFTWPFVPAWYLHVCFRPGRDELAVQEHQLQEKVALIVVCVRRSSCSSTHTYTDTHCTFLSLGMMGSVNVHTPLIHQTC